MGTTTENSVLIEEFESENNEIYRAKPQMTLHLTFLSRAVQQHLKREASIVSQSMYQVQVTLQHLCKYDEGKIIDEAVDKMFKELEDAMHEEQAQLEPILKQSGINAHDVGSAEPRSYKMTVTSQGLNRWLMMLQAVDHHVQIVETLWLVGKIGSTERAMLISNWRKHLNRFKRAIQNLSARSYSKLKASESEQDDQKASKTPAKQPAKAKAKKTTSAKPKAKEVGTSQAVASAKAKTTKKKKTAVEVPSPSTAVA
ncbi:hypothetical protein [uncultured Umboniibacter sp.]|uniref:hypothetical protein n=1 Tax=uncultured Umboniibacter sp. TaxID=1798917 RepID=UPI00261E432D|nr:hypothetical protein [uncultured Umboniibacter sp.]